MQKLQRHLRLMVSVCLFNPMWQICLETRLKILVHLRDVSLQGQRMLHTGIWVCNSGKYIGSPKPAGPSSSFYFPCTVMNELRCHFKPKPYPSSGQSSLGVTPARRERQCSMTFDQVFYDAGLRPETFRVRKERRRDTLGSFTTWLDALFRLRQLRGPCVRGFCCVVVGWSPGKTALLQRICEDTQTNPYLLCSSGSAHAGS